MRIEILCKTPTWRGCKILPLYLVLSDSYLRVIHLMNLTTLTLPRCLTHFMRVYFEFLGFQLRSCLITIYSIESSYVHKHCVIPSGVGKYFLFVGLPVIQLSTSFRHGLKVSLLKLKNTINPSTNCTETNVLVGGGKAVLRIMLI
jgi:hypothetical protein